MNERRSVILRGAPRTGTHLFTEWLVEKHFPQIRVIDANRHRPIEPNSLESNQVLAVCWKHPLSWLVSMHRYVQMSAKGGPVEVDGVRYLSNPDFEAFVHTNETLFDYWIKSYKNWLSIDPLIVIDYEDVVRHPAASVSYFASRLGIDNPETFHPLPGNNLYHGTKFDLKYYLENRWEKEFTDDLWHFCIGRFLP